MQSELERKIMVCPINGQACSSGVRKDFPEEPLTGQKITCRWWIHIAGKDPQHEKILDHFDCALAWMPVLQIEGAQMSRQVSAGTDKVANEISRMHGTFFNALPEEAKQRLAQSPLLRAPENE